MHLISRNSNFVQWMVLACHHNRYILHPATCVLNHRSRSFDGRSRAVLGVLRFAEREWDISVLDHVLDLSPHCILVSNAPVLPLLRICSRCPMRKWVYVLVKANRINQ
jgi:hypothetical protein